MKNNDLIKVMNTWCKTCITIDTKHLTTPVTAKNAPLLAEVIRAHCKAIGLNVIVRISSHKKYAPNKIITMFKTKKK